MCELYVLVCQFILMYCVLFAYIKCTLWLAAVGHRNWLSLKKNDISLLCYSEFITGFIINIKKLSSELPNTFKSQNPQELDAQLYFFLPFIKRFLCFECNYLYVAIGMMYGIYSLVLVQTCHGLCHILS